ncbi:MAG: hypothetical protein NT076_00530 [Candidatus Pacearchaeota archaeon]|nr:hypothetical protein [Candidatus Pacearchaeota archaeon]
MYDHTVTSASCFIGDGRKEDITKLKEEFVIPLRNARNDEELTEESPDVSFTSLDELADFAEGLDWTKYADLNRIRDKYRTLIPKGF